MRSALRTVLLSTALPVGANLLLSGEASGMALDLTGNAGLGFASVKGHTTNLSNVPADSFLTQSGTSPHVVNWSDGVLRWSPHNLFVNSTSAPATQNVTLITGATYTYNVTGSGSLAGTVGASGTASAGSPVTFVATGTSGTFTITGSITTMQINRGSSVLAYHATGASAWFGVPIEWDGVSKYYGMSEPAATNLLVQSQAFDTTWAPTRASVSANAITAPDGKVTADKIVESSATGGHYAAQVAAVSGIISVFAKAAERTRILVYAPTANVGRGFDLSNGTTFTADAIPDAASYGMISYGNGWYRCWVAATSSTGAQLYLVNGTAWSYSGDGASGAYLWQAQEETGSVATSPIPTFAATVTRAVDNIGAATSTFAYSATAGLAVISGRTAKGGGADQTLWSLDDGTANERIRVYRATADGHLYVQVTDGGVDQASIDLGAVANDTDFTVGLSWTLNSIKASLNGGAVTTDASATLPTMTTLRIGRAGTAGTEWNGRFRKLMYAPRVPANDAELQSLQTRVA